MLHKEFWGMLFLAFIAWVFIAGNPSDRIDNFCKPVSWSGNAVTSLSALAIPSQQDNMKQWFNKFNYGCRYMTWRLFYQDDYNAWMLKTQAEKNAITPPESAAPAPAATPAAVPGKPAEAVAPPNK